MVSNVTEEDEPRGRTSVETLGPSDSRKIHFNTVQVSFMFHTCIHFCLMICNSRFLFRMSNLRAIRYPQGNTIPSPLSPNFYSSSFDDTPTSSFSASGCCSKYPGSAPRASMSPSGPCSSSSVSPRRRRSMRTLKDTTPTVK